MVEARNSKVSSQWWWFETQKNGYKNRTPWLQSTVDELDKRINAMLRIIEGDADSFARRAEMFYKKRPELINMVHELYRAHRLLAEGYDQVKSESGVRILSPWQFQLSNNFKYQSEKSVSSTDMTYDSHSEETFDLEESELSDVEDPTEPEGAQIQKENGIEKTSVCNGEVEKLKEEIERLKEESRTQKELLAQKDEEKREAIRQLSLAMDFLREENTSLKKEVYLMNVGREAQRPPMMKVAPREGGFWRKFFPAAHPKAEVSLVTF
ncbi:unnamed protein product [Cuscuta epithymum]|uniref:NAB domain-containing protein n=1 Tax=Cuscuta epithymum TaxID=186058 RepID=A0AAV0FEG1_9ASTE|nr:unnamed protein product [Cuscuta epithymum]